MVVALRCLPFAGPARMLWVMVNGLSPLPALAEPGNLRLDAQAIAHKLNDQGLVDLETWMIDSTAVRATRASSGAGKGCLTSPPTTL